MNSNKYNGRIDLSELNLGIAGIVERFGREIEAKALNALVAALQDQIGDVGVGLFLSSDQDESKLTVSLPICAENSPLLFEFSLQSLIRRELYDLPTLEERAAMRKRLHEQIDLAFAAGPDPQL